MALTDHVLVLAHLGPQVISGPPTQSYEDALRLLGVPDVAIMALPEAHRQQRVGAAGEATATPSALSFTPTGIVTEVDWPCGCGKGLQAHHEFVLQAWAKHVAKAETIDADHLLKHAVRNIDGSWRPDGKPRVECLCGERFQSDDWFPDLAAWEKHVRET